MLDGLDGVVGQPLAGLIVGLLAGQDFIPDDLALATVGFLNSGIEDVVRGFPDISARAVALDEKYDRTIRDNELSVLYLDRFPVRRNGNVVIGFHSSSRQRGAAVPLIVLGAQTGRAFPARVHSRDGPLYGQSADNDINARILPRAAPKEHVPEAPLFATGFNYIDSGYRESILRSFCDIMLPQRVLGRRRGLVSRRSSGRSVEGGGFREVATLLQFPTPSEPCAPGSLSRCPAGIPPVCPLSVPGSSAAAFAPNPPP